jgi:glutamine synthetase
MKLVDLKAAVETGTVDTVILAAPDPFGRLVGKRYRAAHFVESVAGHGSHGCNYLLTVNIEMDPLEGFAIANWASGFGDFILRPDPATYRILPWQQATALVLCDFLRGDDALVEEAPRTVLRRQLERLERSGLGCECATELEFYLYRQTYEEAFAGGYKDLKPSSDYRIDYHLLQPTRDEPLMRAIRNGMTAAGVPIESSKGEWSRGQHEINFIHAPPLPMADRHVLFKHGVKEMASQHGMAASFMAKMAPEEAGNSCHIHISLWRGSHNAFWDAEAKTGTPLFRKFLGGLMKYSPELALLTAPTINSYKRYQSGSWAPTRMAWAHDNRTCGFRVVGHGNSFRIENRMPGADANPYLALAAMIAAGLAGIEENLDAGPAYSGNAYLDDGLARLPETLRDAAERFASSEFARNAFGAGVVEFYSHHARLEVAAFQSAVTDWERRRYFERI